MCITWENGPMVLSSSHFIKSFRMFDVAYKTREATNANQFFFLVKEPATLLKDRKANTRERAKMKERGMKQNGVFECSQHQWGYKES